MITSDDELNKLADRIKQWSRQLGFGQVAITDTNLDQAETRFEKWLACCYHGEMEYMSRHGKKRSRPQLLVADTIRVISARMQYLPQEPSEIKAQLVDPTKAFIARYALGRDYHKLIRKRLQMLADRIEQQSGKFGYRVFCDSAPVLERALAEKSGLGWIGKHTNLINREAGSWFFLGEIYTDLPLPIDSQSGNHCGDCMACIEQCPTGAIVAPYTLDARRCISYLTIELHGSICTTLRPLIGNRIFGCDDCLLACPWNRFARLAGEDDFKARHHLHDADLIDLFGWDETTFRHKTEGSAIRRVGYARWLRNIAIALGNGPASKAVFDALTKKIQHPSELVREHVTWAIKRLDDKKNAERICV